MSFSIHPVSEVSPEHVIQFLCEQQSVPADHVNWKYYDDDFNAGRHRGFAAIQNSQMVGLLGIIPFTLRLGEQSLETAWTCDWFVDAKRASGATGIALLKAATARFDTLFHTGGGQVTKQLFGRLANTTEKNAVSEYRALLRLGYLANRARKRKNWLEKLPIAAADKVPLRRRRNSAASLEKRFCAGISDAFNQALCDPQIREGFRPLYDASYISWFSRNPGLEVYSSHVGQSCSALLWHPTRRHPRQTATEWRLVMINDAATVDELAEFAVAATDFAALNGADSLKVQVSNRDSRLCLALEQAGYSESANLPFFAFYKDPDSMPSNSMSGLSFLDADNATLY